MITIIHCCIFFWSLLLSISTLTHAANGIYNGRVYAGRTINRPRIRSIPSSTSSTSTSSTTTPLPPSSPKSITNSNSNNDNKEMINSNDENKFLFTKFSSSSKQFTARGGYIRQRPLRKRWTSTTNGINLRSSLNSLSSINRDYFSLEKKSSTALSLSSSDEFFLQQSTSQVPYKIIIAGAPASGKGTQCEIITREFGVVHLSTGDILRAAVVEGTPLGVKAKGFMDAGQLVPDELIIGVVCDRLNQDDCKAKGWLLDGFPRTKSQADALNAAGMVPDCFVLLDVPEEVLVERVTGRRTDPKTGKIYHMKFSPPPDNEEILSRLVHRSDDTAEKIKIRYKEFQNHIDSIKSSYESKMIWIDGSLKSNDVAFCVSSSLEEALHKKMNNA